MRCKTKRKLFFLAIDALLIAAILCDFPGEKKSEEIVDDAAIE